jgi:anti-sigma factor RsiW
VSDEMTQHPEELLAEYAEGGLGPEDRARVDSHLAACQRCRHEVGLAAEARTALGALAEAAPPPGLELAVRRRARGPSRRVWAVAGAAAVAAGVVAAAIVVFGSQDRGQDALTGAGAPEEAQGQATPEAAGGDTTQRDRAPSSVTVQGTNRDYTATSLAALGRRLRAQAQTSVAARLDATSQEFYAEFDLDSLSPRVRRTVDCVFREVPPDRLLVPYLIQEASFEGRPAYVAAFLQGPSPDTPHDRLLIWVVDRESCSLQYYAAQQL